MNLWADNGSVCINGTSEGHSFVNFHRLQQAGVRYLQATYHRFACSKMGTAAEGSRATEHSAIEDRQGGSSWSQRVSGTLDGASLKVRPSFWPVLNTSKD